MITGRIIAIEKHPDADKLVVCQVDTGGRSADRHRRHQCPDGSIVPVALDGATLAGGQVIRSGKLRGRFPMACCAVSAELGFTSSDFPERGG